MAPCATAQVVVHGMGGVGKTTLAASLLRQDPEIASDVPFQWARALIVGKIAEILVSIISCPPYLQLYLQLYVYLHS